METEIVASWYETAKNDDIVVDASDVNAEGRANVWTFNLRRDAGGRSIDPDQVSDFVLAIRDERRSRLAEIGRAGKMLFYFWYEDQVGSFRFSLVSKSHGCLPFGCNVVVTDDLATLVRNAIALPQHALVDCDFDTEEPPMLDLDVWVCEL